MILYVDIEEVGGLFLFLSIILSIISFLIYLFKRPRKRKNDYEKYVKKIDVLYNAIMVYPELEDYLYYRGAKSIKNPIVKTTFAKKTTFEGLARALGRNPDEFIKEVNEFIAKKVKRISQ